MKFILFVFDLLIVYAYNIDTKYPIIYPDSALNADQYVDTQFNRSYFGYSVLLHHDPQKNASWLFVGAPRGNYTKPSRNKLLKKSEPGVAYRCNLPGSCVEIESTVLEDEKVYIRQIGMRAYLTNDHSWFGGAMSIERYSGFLTICAPRTIMSIFPDKKELKYVNTMQGMCYSNQMLSNTMTAEIFEINQFDYSRYTWFDPIQGFSVMFASTQEEETISRVVGNPNDEVVGSINVGRFSRAGKFDESSRKMLNLTVHDDTSQYGYMITAGYYFDQKRFLYACSDPGWNYVGQVVVIDTNKESAYTNAHLFGSDIGEFFGAGLASGDLNNDGLDDLIVGSPLWGNDNGKVYIYLGQPEEEFEAVVILEGAAEDAQFGYTVASGDLDKDGFSDIIVGAPWEGSGVIYIYYGDASLKNKVRPAVSQRIEMESSGLFPTKEINIRTFGFSISEPIDIDDNGYADIAVGAYKSGHVIILRSKPVAQTNLTIITTPSILKRNDSNFLITACVKYHGYDTANMHPFKISLIVDKKYKRTKETSLEMVSANPPLDMCINVTVTLSTNIQDFIEPINIYASHKFTHDVLSSAEFCKTCPVESKDNKSSSVQNVLPFDIGCGEDRICNCNITATMKFLGVRENNSWAIGSNDIILETVLENHDELAYLTTIAFTFPNGIILHSILPSCEEDRNGNILIVVCEVSNPLKTNEQKIVKLDLDMRYITDGSLHGTVLNFSAEIKTRSVNHGMHKIQLSLALISEASSSLNGKAIEKSYYLPESDDDQLNITFQHHYHLLKLGATSIEEAELSIDVPTSVNDSDSFVDLYQPRIYISGKYYDCLSSGIDLVNDGQQNDVWKSTASNDIYNLNNDTSHSLSKRDITDKAVIAAHFMQKLYYAKLTSNDQSGNNLTSWERDTVYLNCSTIGVNCATVCCNLRALKTQKDVGKLVMKLILNVTKLKDNFGLRKERKVIRFSTNAHVQIMKPANRISFADDNDVILTTEFYSTAKPEKLQLWVVFVSVTLGLIFLFIIIIILSMVGFFRRTTKEELSAINTTEIEDRSQSIEQLEMIEAPE
ncbi:integrin alpha-PS3-like isoform X2 [Pseudomyrmex gracilis]|nr:integrin alpha-PS3-like isoform X2 [Pseudomyrmex gracilis]